jgi:urease accessory protein
MERDAKRMRGDGPTLFTAVRHGKGVDRVVQGVLGAWREATGSHADAGPATAGGSI